MPSPNKERLVSLYGRLSNEQEPYEKSTNFEGVVIKASSSTGENKFSGPKSDIFETASYKIVTDKSRTNMRYKQEDEEVS